VLLVALAGGGMYLRITRQPAQFAANATLMVTAPVMNAPMSAVGEGGGPGGMQRSPGAIFNDIIHLLTTRPVLERVAKKLGYSGPSAVRGNLSASQIRNTDLVRINATAKERESAARIANTAADELIAYFREINRRDMHAVRGYIEQQLMQARQRLEDSDRMIQAYKERHRIVDIAQARSQAANEAATARTERDSTMLALRETEARLAASRAKLSGESLERVQARTTRDNPVFVQLQSHLTELEIQRSEASQVFTPMHPKMKQLDGQIAEVRQRMLNEAKTTLSDQTVGANPLRDQLLGQVVQYEVDRAATAAKLAAVNFLTVRRQSGLRTIPGIETGLAMLTRENKILEENYASLSTRYQEALIRENEAGFVPAGLHVMESAIAPSAPISARLPLMTGIAALVGLLLGVMGAIVLETSDDRIRTSQDAERTLGVPVLVEVPDMSTPKVAPAGAALLVALVLCMVAGGSVVAARTMGDSAGPGAPVSMLVRLGRGIDHLTVRLGQAIR
jgi:uncharacterized protein involved in exopolysaccharide biosynthesis